MYGFGILCDEKTSAPILCSHHFYYFNDFILFNIISSIVVATHTHATCTLLYRNCGFEFAIKKNLKQDRIMVALMRLNKISICFVELFEIGKNTIIVTIVTSYVIIISAQFISHLGETFSYIFCCFSLLSSLFQNIS